MNNMGNQTITDKDKKMSGQYPTEVPNEMIEEQTKKIPNLVFLAAAGVSIVASAYLTFGQKKQTFGNFVGLWAPTILLFGLYNKMVKVEDELVRMH